MGNHADISNGDTGEDDLSDLKLAELLAKILSKKQRRDVDFDKLATLKAIVAKVNGEPGEADLE